MSFDAKEYARMYYHNIIKPKKPRKAIPIYAVYKGDNFVCDGTRKEICEKLNISRNTFYYYRSKHWQERCHKGNNHRTIIMIDND